MDDVSRSASFSRGSASSGVASPASSSSRLSPSPDDQRSTSREQNDAKAQAKSYKHRKKHSSRRDDDRKDKNRKRGHPSNGDNYHESDNQKPRQKSKKSKKNKEDRRKQSKRRRKENDDDDDDNSSDSYSDSSAEPDRRKHRRKESKRQKHSKVSKRKKRRHRDRLTSEDGDNALHAAVKVLDDEDSRLQRNYEIADAICSLFSDHPALASELPILLIRLGSGSSVDLRQMTNPHAAHGLARILTHLEPFGVQRQQQQQQQRPPGTGMDSAGCWIWHQPVVTHQHHRPDTSLVLIRTIRALLNEIGLTMDAIDTWERQGAQQQQPQQHSRSHSSSTNAIEQIVSSIKQQHGFNQQTRIAVESIIDAILRGELADLRDIHESWLNDTVESLFRTCGLIIDDSCVPSGNQATNGSNRKRFRLPLDGQEQGARSNLLTALDVFRSSEGDGIDAKGTALQNNNNSDSDDEGPLPEGVKRTNVATQQAVRTLPGPTLEGQNDPLGREEWMLTPGEHDLLSAIASQPLRSRKFQAGSKADVVAASQRASIDPVTQRELAAIREAQEKARGPSLMQQHQEKMKLAAAATLDADANGNNKTKSRWKWNREHDLDAGRRVDKNALNNILEGASDLKSKFHSAS